MRHQWWRPIWAWWKMSPTRSRNHRTPLEITEGGGIEKTWRNQKQRRENTLLILRNSILRLVNAWVFPIGSWRRHHVARKVWANVSPTSHWLVGDNITAELEECWMRFPDGTVKKLLRSRLLPLPTQLPRLNDWAVVVDPRKAKASS